MTPVGGPGVSASARARPTAAGFSDPASVRPAASLCRSPELRVWGKAWGLKARPSLKPGRCGPYLSGGGVSVVPRGAFRGPGGAWPAPPPPTALPAAAGGGAPWASGRGGGLRSFPHTTPPLQRSLSSISNSTGRPTARPALMAQAPCARRVQARPMILAAAATSFSAAALPRGAGGRGPGAGPGRRRSSERKAVAVVVMKGSTLARKSVRVDPSRSELIRVDLNQMRVDPSRFVQMHTHAYTNARARLQTNTSSSQGLRTCTHTHT